jgi:RNA polymerase sigma factor (sigma-70 family)
VSPPPTAPESLPTADHVRWFAEEVQPHESKLRAWLTARFPSITDTDDLVQESYARLIRARETGRIGNAKAYLFATAFNAALDLFRRSRVVPFDAVGDFDRLSVLEERPDACETVSRNEELQVLREAVEALPTRCRQVFTLRKLYGLSHKEIAARLGISGKTVEEQVNRATRRCAAFLRSRGMP